MKKTEILIYDEISIGSAKSIVEQLAAAGEKPVELRINSPGGDVFSGYAIYNALVAHAAGVTVYIDGVAASMASYIAMAGRRIIMAENAMIMIHNPTCSTHGDADAAHSTSELLRSVETAMIDGYAKRSGHDRKRIAQMMDDETWLTADMAKELGFVDEIAEPMKLAASFSMKHFRHAPSHLDESQSTQKLEAADLAGVTADRNNFRAQVHSLTAKLEASQREVGLVRSMLERSKNNLALLESYAKANGLDVIGVEKRHAIADVPSGDFSAGGDILAQYDAIADSAERTRWYRANKEAFNAAFAARASRG